MKQQIKTYPAIYPLPVAVLATHNEDGSVNVMTAAWGCPIDGDLIGICLSSDHKTVENFHRNGVLSVSLASEDTIAEADYFGLVSGHEDPHKLETVGFHAHIGELTGAPIIEEFPVSMECKFDHEEEDTGMTYFRIVALHASENVVNERGKIDLVKAKAVCYDSGSRSYRRIGESVAPAYAIGNKFKRS